jgi:hypothetical protein
MGKSKKSNNQQQKVPKRTERKTSFQNLKVDALKWGEEEQINIQDEKKTPIYSPATCLHKSEVHRCISDDNFKGALYMLQNPDPESEDMKFAAATYVDEKSGETATQSAIRKNAPIELLELLVFIGGKSAVMKKNCNGYNAVHLACKRGSHPDVVDTLLYVGGKESLYDTDHVGELPMHKVCLRDCASTEIVQTLIDAGGRQMLEHRNNDEMLPVHCCVYWFNTNLDVCQILVTEGLHHGIGGEAGAGGLFVEYLDIDQTHKTTFDKLKQTDSSNDLIEKIVSVSEKVASSVTEAGARQGLKWEKGMQELVECTDTGALKVGMVTLAASGEDNDLTTIFELCKRYVGPLFG